MKALNANSRPREFLRFVVPSTVSMIVFSTYSMVDGWFVARGVGELALAAVNLTMPFVNGMFAIAILLSVGTSTVCAIHLGKGESRKAAETFTHSVMLIAGLALAITLAVWLFGDEIASFLGASEGTREYVVSYLRIICCFSLAFMVAYCLEVLVKTGGHPAFAALGVGTCCITNIVLDYVFVLRLGMGIEGAAYATGIAQTASLVLFAAHFLSGRSTIRFKFTFKKPQALKRIVASGMSSFFEELSLGLTAFMFNRALLAWVGEKGVIAYAIVGYVNTLVLMTMTGITQGMQPIVSFNLGRGNENACRGYRRYAIISVVACSLLFFTVCRVWPEKIVSMMLKSDSGNFAYTAASLKAFSFGFLLVGINIVSAGFFTAMERPSYAMGLSLARGFVVITATLFATIAFMGAENIWYASALSESVCLFLTLLATSVYFRQETLQSEMS